MKFEFLTEVLLKLELLRDVTVCGWVSSSDVLKDHGAFTLDVDALSSPSNTVLHPKELNLLDRYSLSCKVTLEPTWQMTSLKSRVLITVGQMMYVKYLSAAWFILLVYSTVFEKTCL